MEQRTAFVPPQELFFEDILAQAVEAPSDELAQEVLRLHVQEVIDAGDAERLMAMSMVLGATACMHPHLENLANMLGEQAMPHGEQENGGRHKEATEADEDDETEEHSPAPRRRPFLGMRRSGAGFSAPKNRTLTAPYRTAYSFR